MRYHRCITFKILRFTLLLDDFALESHNFDLLGDFLKVNCSRWLLMIFNIFNADSSETLLSLLLLIVRIFMARGNKFTLAVDILDLKYSQIMAALVL